MFAKKVRGGTTWNIRRFTQTISNTPIYISTPVYYVNSSPHIGHLYSCLVADSLSRWYKLLGNRTLLSTGTDEHGLKVQQAATNNMKDCQSYCDDVSSEFRSVFQRAHISYDVFLRTSSKEHHDAVQHMWRTLVSNGYIYMGQHEGWYCVSDECFVQDLDIEDAWPEHLRSNPDYATVSPCGHKDAIKVMKDSGHRVVWVAEENYMFRLSAFQSRLVAWLKANPKVVQPTTQYEAALAMARSEELRDVSVSRLSSLVNWAVRVPDDPSHSVYVWFDALINYLVACQYPCGAVNASGWPAQYHIVGKDILRFHAILWPAMLMAADLPLPLHIVSHGHFLVKQQKMSKSLGNAVSPVELMDRYGTDAVRFFLLGAGKVDRDNCFDLVEGIQRYNACVPNTIGNLLHRCCAGKLVPKDGRLKCPTCTDGSGGTLLDEYQEFCDAVSVLPELVSSDFSQVNISSAMFRVMNTLHRANALFSACEPWKLRKSSQPSDQQRLSEILYYVADCVRICAILMLPVAPQSMTIVLDRMGIDESDRVFSACKWGYHAELCMSVMPAAHKEPPVFSKLPLPSPPSLHRCPSSNSASSVVNTQT